MSNPSDDDCRYEPTARRVAQARSAGYLATSRDSASGFVMVVVCVALIAGGRSVLGGLVAAMRESLGGAAGGFLFRAAMGAGERAAFSALALPVAAVLVAALAIGLAQTRGLVRARLLHPDGRRILPQWRRFWEADKLGRATVDLAKVGLVIAVAGVSLCSSAAAIIGLAGASVSRILNAVFELAKNLGLAVALTMLGVGAADYLWQIHRYRKALRMTYDEVKRERKEMEGDPVFKSERKRIQVELSQAHALADLAQADLVLVDTGRTAIALRYATSVAQAPFVMFRGRHRLAARAEAIARDAGIPVVVDAGLVAQLVATQEDDEIPETLYEPVAQLLAQTRLRRDSAKAVGGDRDSPRT